MLLTAVKGNRDAADFLATIVAVLHFWDDLIDKDQQLTDKDINDAFWKALIVLPRNNFYREHFHLLNPLLMAAIHNWSAATKLEREGDSGDKHIAFILRSSYVDLITQSALLVGGPEWAEEVTPTIRRFTHSEGYEGYLKNLAEEESRRTGHATQA